jgi:FlaA1/EpsC-like NDP-sugar epimerase
MNRSFKRLILMFVDVMVILSAHAISYVFFDPLVSIPPRTFLIHIIFVILTYIVFGVTIKIFDKINRFTSIRETIIHAFLVTIAYVVGTVLYNVLGEGLSFRHVALAYLISVIAIPASRVVWRIYMEHQLKLEKDASNGEDMTPIRTLIIGAGEAGAIFVRSIRMRSDITVVGFLDDDRNKQGTTVYGHPVIGTVKDLEDTVDQYRVEQITIAIPSLSNNEMNAIVNQAQKTVCVNISSETYFFQK